MPPFTSSGERMRALRFRLREPDSLAIFIWHQVTPAFDPDRHHPYTWTPLAAFEAAIHDIVQTHRIMPLNEALAAIESGNLRGRCAALTFDDGDRSMADYVAPLLLHLRLPATFFINTGYLRGDSTYWFPVMAYAGAHLPHELKQCGQQLRLTDDPDLYRSCRALIEHYAGKVPSLNDRLVTPDWLARLDGVHFAIGAHGHEHQRYAMMTAEWQRDDLRTNLAALRDFRGFRPIFALPFGKPGDVSADIGPIAREEKLEVVLAGGGINSGERPFYDRIPADNVAIKSVVRRAMALHA